MSTEYRPKWVENVLNGRSVLQLALDVHMKTCGSYEPMGDTHEGDLFTLKWISENWRNEGICDFDDAVLAVIKAAIAETESDKAS